MFTISFCVNLATCIAHIMLTHRADGTCDRVSRAAAATTAGRTDARLIITTARRQVTVTCHTISQ